MTKVVYTRASTLGVPDAGLVEQQHDAVAQTGSGIGTPAAPAIAEERCARPNVTADCEACLEVAAQLLVCTCRQRHHARLVELRLAHSDDARLRINVGECQAHHFAAAQSGCVEEHDRQAQDLRTQR